MGQIARKEQWGNLSDPAREQFFWKDPGLPKFDNDDVVVVPKGGRDEDGKVLPPPDNFLLMILQPTRCDYLRLTDNYRQIDNFVVAAATSIEEEGIGSCNRKEEGSWI